MMGLVKSGIDRVEAMPLAAGIAEDGRSVDEPLSVLVRWRSANAEMLHQVYVNGELCGVTSDCSQRSIVVGFPAMWSSCVRIEVFAVEVGEAYEDFGDELDSSRNSGRVEIGWLRGMGLPFSGAVQIVDGDGVTVDEIALSSGPQDESGFGACRFGSGGFGYDGCSCVGFGVGMFGAGEFGFDADEMHWISGELADGEYTFGVRTIDAEGNAGPIVDCGEIVVVKGPAGIERFAIASLDGDELAIDIVVG